ncbi:MAG: hypothetical protein AAFS07_13865 [Pseudomonadota bacterium]
MITMMEVIEMTGLTEAEVDAVAEHEHLPEAAAAALACYLVERGPLGRAEIAQMMRDDIRAALKRGDRAHAAEVLGALKHFLATHGSAAG